MGDEEGHGGTSSGSSATVAQPSTSQSPMFHQISPPQPLSLRPSGEVADNWKLWKETYNSYFVISRLDRESSPYQLAMFKHTIGDDALKVIKTFSYTEGEDSNNWRMLKWRNTALEKSMRSMSGTVLTSGISIHPSRSIVLLPS